MIKNFLSSLCLFLLLAACTQEDMPAETTFGYLTLEGVALQTAETVPLTRAIDADLYVEIAQGNTQKALYTPGEVPETIKLPVGSYTLRAYNAAYTTQSSWSSAELGEAVYYAETIVDIKEEETNALVLNVPMTNVGVTFSLPEHFEEWFHNATFSILAGNRQIQLAIGETAYFAYTEGMTFTYTLSALNADNEPQNYLGISNQISPGTVYTITYNLPAGINLTGN